MATQADILTVISATPSPYQAGQTITYAFLTTETFNIADYSGFDFGSGSYLGNFNAFGAAQIAGLVEIFKIIESVCGLQFRPALTGETPNIRFGNTDQPSGGINLQGTSNGQFINDVLIANNNTDMTLGEHGYATLIHEILHALGFKHYSEGQPVLLEDGRPVSVMSGDSEADDGLQGITPLLLDIGALHALYGQRLSPVSNNAYSQHAIDNTYVFNANTGTQNLPFEIFRDQIKTIWDSGGTDTFSVSSNYSESVYIRLRPGELSSIGGYRNIAIAFEAEIENATGGSGNDFIIGNHLANSLVGGAGTDILDGGIAENAGSGLTPIGQGDGANDTLQGGTDSDVYAGDGNDSISFSTADGIGTINLGTGHDTVIGSNGNDTFTGNEDNNDLHGGNGHDTLAGGQGKDEIYGGTGDDELSGNEGSDYLDGGAVSSSGAATRVSIVQSPSGAVWRMKLRGSVLSPPWMPPGSVVMCSCPSDSSTVSGL